MSYPMDSYEDIDDPPPPDEQRGRLRIWWDRCIAEGRTIPEAFTHPQNLMQVWEYAKTAAFTTATDGQGLVRNLNVAWAWLMTPFIAATLLALWALPRFGRAVVFTACTLIISTGVAQIPAIGWLVPGVLNITRW